MDKTREIKNNVRFLIKSILFISLALLLCSVNIAAQETQLNIRISGDIKTLDPAHISDSVSEQIANLIYLRLINLKPYSSELEPSLALSWETSDDGKTYTFHLRDDLYWHRGFGQVTAEDVAFSYERIRDGLGEAAASRYRKELSLIEEIEVVDPFTLRLYLSKPLPSLLAASLSFRPGFIVCKEAIEKYGGTYTSNAVGCGPFELVEWRFGQEILLKKFEEYFDADNISIETIRARIIGEDTVAMLALKTGEVDVGVFQDYSVFEALKALPGIITKSKASNTINWIMLNTKVKPFDDVRVRKALAYAIDRDEIAAAAPGVSPQHSVIPQGLGYDDVIMYEHNPEKAIELLKEAGYPDGFDFELVYYTGPVTTWNLIVPVVQEQWKRIGVKLTLWAAEQAAYMVKRNAGDYDAVVKQTGRVEVFQLLEPYYHSKNTPPGGNNSYYDEIDELLERATSQTEEEKIRESVIEIQKKIAEDVPVIALGTTLDMVAWRDNIEGMSIQPQWRISAWQLKKN